MLEGIHHILEAAHGDYRYYQFKDGRKIEVVDNYYCYIIPRSSPSSHSLDLVRLRRVFSYLHLKSAATMCGELGCGGRNFDSTSVKPVCNGLI